MKVIRDLICFNFDILYIFCKWMCIEIFCWREYNCTFLSQFLCIQVRIWIWIGDSFTGSGLSLWPNGWSGRAFSMIFIIIFYDIYDITLIKYVLLKRHLVARPVSESNFLDLEVGEESGMHTKWKQSQTKSKSCFGTLENNTDNRNPL